MGREVCEYRSPGRHYNAPSQSSPGDRRSLLLGGKGTANSDAKGASAQSCETAAGFTWTCAADPMFDPRVAPDCVSAGSSGAVSGIRFGPQERETLHFEFGASKINRYPYTPRTVPSAIRTTSIATSKRREPSKSAL